jgi:hypothetical protein
MKGERGSALREQAAEGLIEQRLVGAGKSGEDFEEPVAQVGGRVVGALGQQQDHTLPAQAAVLALAGSGVELVAEDLGIIVEAEHRALVAAHRLRHLIGAQHALARKEEVEGLLPGGEIDGLEGGGQGRRYQVPSDKWQVGGSAARSVSEVAAGQLAGGSGQAQAAGGGELISGGGGVEIARRVEGALLHGAPGFAGQLLRGAVLSGPEPVLEIAGGRAHAPAFPGCPAVVVAASCSNVMAAACAKCFARSA